MLRWDFQTLSVKLNFREKILTIYWNACSFVYPNFILKRVCLEKENIFALCCIIGWREVTNFCKLKEAGRDHFEVGMNGRDFFFFF